tara:strand:+ start:947 stop:3067 length:2121 start_codon:yes stop_codon:yes gene_type:complete
MAYENSEANDRKNSSKKRKHTEAGYDTGSSDLDLALERFKDSDDNSDHNRIKYQEDVEFGRLGDQWEDAVAQSRRDESRPCLTINKLPSFIRQVVNESRQNKPGIVVNPIDNGADPETARVLNGIVRAILRNSNADQAFDTGIDCAVSGGFGFMRVDIEYAHEQAFEMEAVVRRIMDPLTVHWDVTTESFDATDWKYGFISSLYPEAEFKQMYPDAEPVDFSEGSQEDIYNVWKSTEHGVRVAEYFCKEEEEHELWLIKGFNFQRPDGEVIDTKAIRKDHLPGLAKQWGESMGIEVPEGIGDEELIAYFFEMRGLKVMQSRTVQGTKVVKRIITGKEIIEESEWPGDNIPIIPVWGEEVVSRGLRYFRSMITDARDSQIMYNFWRSAETEIVAMQPKNPWVVEEGAIPADGEKDWEDANKRSIAYLTYKKGYKAPVRAQPPMISSGALQNSLHASDDMKSIIGIYDSALGARSNEVSGRAILARQKESDVSNYHFVDNLSRSITYLGKVLLEIIPNIYSARQVVRTVGEDAKESVAHLMLEGQGVQLPDMDGQYDGTGLQTDENGNFMFDKTKPPNRLYDLNVGKYDVTVKAGPSYASKREETRETLIEIMRQVPGSAPLLGDILLQHLDFEGAEEVAERLKQFVATQIPGMANMTAGLAAGQSPQMPGTQPIVSPIAGSVPQGNQPIPNGNGAGTGQQFSQGVPR